MHQKCPKLKLILNTGHMQSQIISHVPSSEFFLFPILGGNRMVQWNITSPQKGEIVVVYVVYRYLIFDICFFVHWLFQQ